MSSVSGRKQASREELKMFQFSRFHIQMCKWLFNTLRGKLVSAFVFAKTSMTCSAFTAPICSKDAFEQHETTSQSLEPVDVVRLFKFLQ